MAEELVMPRLSDTMEEGTISRWLKHEGDTISKGEAVAEIETDKSNMEYFSYLDGVITQIIVGEGQSAPIGNVIAYVGTTDEVRPGAPSPGGSTASTGPGTEELAEKQPAAASAPAVQQPTADSALGEPRPRPDSQATRSQSGPAGRLTTGQEAASREAPLQARGHESDRPAESEETVKASPLARRLAREHGIDLVTLSGTGPGGRVVREDVERAVAQQPATQIPSVTQTRPSAQPTPPSPAKAPAATSGTQPTSLTRMQQVIARRMVESKTTVPHFYLTTEIDMAAALSLRTMINQEAEKEAQVTINSLIVRAVAVALERFPDANGSFKGDHIELHDHINVGVAVSVERGLVVPVVRDANRKGIAQIDREVRALASRGRDGKLAPSDYEGGTFSVSNLGMFDVDEFQAIVNPPEAGILAVGSVRDQPVVVDGAIVIGKRMRATLSADHRILYGAPAALFLQEIKRLLEHPTKLAF